MGAQLGGLGRGAVRGGVGEELVDAGRGSRVTTTVRATAGWLSIAFSISASSTR
ncbi:hypothetical protein GA0115246_110027 [Streptomyces sp. SolWspMP-sol7th]|nr:hypothetical protein GA0115246_110027 [Streptomyces sp. SolWspMP-sol7th]